jgi:hypothetical protein
MTNTQHKTAAERLAAWAARARQTSGQNLEPFHGFDGHDGPELRVSDIEELVAGALSLRNQIADCLRREERAAIEKTQRPQPGPTADKIMALVFARFGGHSL